MDPSGSGTPKPDVIPEMMAAAMEVDNFRLHMESKSNYCNDNDVFLLFHIISLSNIFTCSISIRLEILSLKSTITY